MNAQEIAQHLDDNGFQDAPVMEIVDEIVDLLPEPADGCFDNWSGWERAERIACNYLVGLYD